LDKALKARESTPEQVQTRADRYLFPVACALWLQHHSLKSAEPRPSDGYLLAESVIIAIDPDVEIAGVDALE